ncbi:MAG TPA: hypothetical protein PK048_02635 [Candidatus Absconditabacterales bacterium]|nr:hypothetical protein [Candidatus Absconditabacterales bacterium]
MSQQQLEEVKTLPLTKKMSKEKKNQTKTLYFSKEHKDSIVSFLNQLNLIKPLDKAGLITKLGKQQKQEMGEFGKRIFYYIRCKTLHTNVIQSLIKDFNCFEYKPKR